MSKSGGSEEKETDVAVGGTSRVIYLCERGNGKGVVGKVRDKLCKYEIALAIITHDHTLVRKGTYKLVRRLPIL